MSVTIDLGGRVAVVTGAASGIGRASAAMLGAAGATVVCADLDGDGALATAAAIVDAGGTGSGVALDVTQQEAVDAVVVGAVADHGRLDVMCNIAGIAAQRNVLDLTEADLDRVWAVNFKGVLFGCQAAGRVMVEQGSGSIVNMASVAVDLGQPGLVSYAVAKAGVVQLTRTLASEIGPNGVRVNAVAPGFIVTAMTSRRWTAEDGTVDEAGRDTWLELMARTAPLRRTGEPDDVANLVLYLASDASSFVTGQVIRANAGVTMPW